MWGNAWVTITHELTLGKTWLFLGWCVYMFGPSGPVSHGTQIRSFRSLGFLLVELVKVP